MTGTINRYGIYEADHSKFGGYVHSSDFNTSYRGKDNTKGSSISRRIESDFQFDKQCRRNIENRKIRRD